MAVSGFVTGHLLIESWKAPHVRRDMIFNPVALATSGSLETWRVLFKESEKSKCNGYLGKDHRSREQAVTGTADKNKARYMLLKLNDVPW